MKISKVVQLLILSGCFLPLLACGAKTVTTLKEGPRVYSDLDQSIQTETPFTLKSTSLENEGTLGSSIGSIALEWSHSPSETKSFVIQMISTETQEIYVSVAHVGADRSSYELSLLNSDGTRKVLSGDVQIRVYALHTEESLTLGKDARADHLLLARQSAAVAQLSASLAPGL